MSVDYTYPSEGQPSAACIEGQRTTFISQMPNDDIFIAMGHSLQHQIIVHVEDVPDFVEGLSRVAGHSAGATMRSVQEERVNAGIAIISRLQQCGWLSRDEVYAIIRDVCGIGGNR